MFIKMKNRGSKSRLTTCGKFGIGTPPLKFLEAKKHGRN
jgi:hypothetical protein